MNSLQSDFEIVSAVLAGNSAQFAELVRRWQTMIMRYFLSHHSLEDAQELTQETFLNSWKSLRTYNPKWKFSTWLLAIAHQQNALFFRKQARTVPVVNEEEDALSEIPAEDASFGVEELFRNEEVKNLWKIIREKLSPEQGDALWMFYAEEKSVQEIAMIFGKSPSGVKTLLFRARQNLKKFLTSSASKK